MQLKGNKLKIKNLNIRSKKTKKSLIYIWLVTYLCVLIIPIIAGGIMYLKTNRLYSNEINLYANLSLNNAMMKFEEALDEAQWLSIDFAKSQQLLLLNSMKVSDKEYYYRMELLREYLMNKKENASDYISFYIYIDSADRVIYPTSMNDAKTFVHNHYSDDKDTYEQWLNTMSQVYHNKYVVMNDTVNLIQSVPIGAKDSFFANIVVSIDFNELFNSDEEGSLREYQRIALISKTGELLFYDGDDSGGIKDIIEKAVASGESWISVDNEKLKVSIIQSKKHKWSLAVTEPGKYFWEKVNSVNRIFCYIYVSCFILGLAVILTFVRWQYRPVKSLLESFGGKEHKNEYKVAEYTDIHNKFKEIISKTNVAEKKIMHQQEIIKLHNLQKILRGDITSKLFKEDDAFLRLNFSKECYAVIVFNIISYDDLFSDGEELCAEKKKELANLVIANISEELINDKYTGYVIEYEGNLVCIINYSEEAQTSFKNELSEILKHIHEFVKENFYMEFLSGVGSEVLDIEKVYISYEKATQTIEYLIFNDAGVSAFYEDIKTNNIYYYPLQKEIQLFNNLKNADSNNCRELLEEIFEKNSDIYIQGKIAINRLVYSLINTLINGCEDEAPQFSSRIFETGGDMEWFFKTTDINSIKIKIIGLFEQACEIIAKSKDKSETNLIVQRAVDYVKMNYSNYDISVSIIAQKLDIHPYYLSTVFKNNMGIGLLEYIHKQKIDKVKELLLQDETITLEKLATMVGFANYRSLLRVFKKYTGMSPSEYKDMNRNLQNIETKEEE